MSDKISRAELFDRLATITAEDANEMKAKIYAVTQEMPTDPGSWEDIDWTELHDNLSRGMAELNLAIRSAMADMAESIRTAVTLCKPPKGHWIYKADDLFPAESMQECSVCHEEEYFSLCNENFCPNCGADMREREGE